MNEGITKPLMGKVALLMRIQTAFEAVIDTLEQHDDQELLKTFGSGGWTLKDALAHIAAWEMILLEFHMGGQAFETVTDLDGAVYRETPYDVINAHLYARYKGLAPGEVRQLVLDTHAGLITALEDFPEEDLYQPHPVLSVGEAAGLNWIDYIAANTYDHYEEHLAELR